MVHIKFDLWGKWKKQERGKIKIWKTRNIMKTEKGDKEKEVNKNIKRKGK